MGMYGELDTAGSGLTSTVPMAAVAYVDQGLDPGGYAAKSLHQLAELNEKLHGEVTALDSFALCLRDSLAAAGVAPDPARVAAISTE